MKTKKQKLRSKADKLWYEVLKKPHCEICGKEAIQVHHFYPKGLYGHLRYDLDNGISLCMGCHFTHHHKGDPSIHNTIIAKRGRLWFNRLKKKALVRPEGSYLTVKYYQNIIEELKNYEI